MTTTARSTHDDVWNFGPAQDIAYTTVTFPLRIDTIEHLAAVEIMMAAWSLMRPAKVEAVTAIKGFYRRRQDWITLEIVAPGKVNHHVPEFISAIFDPASCAEFIEPARGVAASALRVAGDRNGLIAGQAGWGGVLGVTPAALRVPTEAELEGVSVAKVLDVLTAAAATAKTIVVSGSDSPLPDIGPLDRRATVESAAVQPSARLGFGRGSGMLLTRRIQGTAAVRLLLPAGSVSDKSVLYGLLTLCVPLGGTHHSLLARQLRDELGIAYLPTVSIEVVSGELYIVAAWDADSDAVAPSIERAIRTISSYFQDGEWRHQWQAGQAQVLSIYEDSWSDARGKGVFVASSVQALGSFPGYDAIIDSVKALSDTSLTSVVSRIDVGQLSGAIAGEFDAAALRSVANVYGLEVRQARED